MRGLLPAHRKEATTTDNKQRPPSEREQEELFAVFCAHLGSPWEAARRVGFEPHLADAAACALIAKPHIRRKIKQHEKSLDESASGLALRQLLRLAGYSAQDGVKLAFSGEGLCPEEVEALDLFGVSSLKWSSAGCEVKFFDRLRAIELLLALTGTKEDACPTEFYRVLRESAAQLEQTGEVAAEGGDDHGD